MQTQTTGQKLKEMLLSKKFLTLIGSILVMLLAVFGVEVTEDQVSQVIAFIIAVSMVSSSYLVGQGMSDKGKEAEKIRSLTSQKE